jgi:5-formyltetrahydrofolate cyclo-ligase
MPAGPQVGVGARALVGLGVRVVLVPALAVDRSGTRLGQGGGYYDRLLAELVAGTDARPALVAVVHDDEVLPAGTIPRRSHDVPVEAALTESALVRLGAD